MQLCVKFMHKEGENLRKGTRLTFSYNVTCCSSLCFENVGFHCAMLTIIISN